MNKIVIDSCVYVSHFGIDKLTPKSKAFFKRISQTDTQIILPALVEAEVLVVLHQNGATRLDKISQLFSQMIFSPLNKELIRGLTSFIESNQSSLKTSDLIIALTAKLNDAALITWDKQLLGSNICETASPENYRGP
ncbi:MAG: PIN domain-containing protein [Patescibacteria group bacterium]